MVMSSKGKPDRELWVALQALDNDILDPEFPTALVEEELKGLGIDPAALAKRGRDFVSKVTEEERLSWQAHARAQRAELEARASKAVLVPPDLSRTAILARLEELRSADSTVGVAIRMAARKRKPEQSSDEELRSLLAEMEALRSMEGNESK
jgi:hypothetical protein